MPFRVKSEPKKRFMPLLVSWLQISSFICIPSCAVLFKERGSRQHVEFINSALRYVKEYGVHKELDTYKALLNVFPKGKMIPQNTFQVYCAKECVFNGYYLENHDALSAAAELLCQSAG